MPEILGMEVGTTGFGLMGLTWRTPPPPLPQSLAAMHASLRTSPPCNVWNGGEFYDSTSDASYNSCHLVRKYLETYPEDKGRFLLSVKGGLKRGAMVPDGGRENVRRSVGQCLEDLGGCLERIDIFECARVDPNTPIEVTMAALEELVKEGKIGGVSLSEVGERTIRRAAKVTKIVGVEVELSLWAQEPLQNGVAKACAELGIPLIAYSPIGRGMLSGTIKSPSDIPATDFRAHAPRFQPENFATNFKFVKAVGDIATQKGITSAQLALAWVRTLSKRNGNPEIIPIPGARTEERVRENAVDLRLNDAEMEKLEEVCKGFAVKGGRYPEAHSALLEG